MLPVLFSNDYLYCIGGILMALSSGYLSSLTMMFAPRSYSVFYFKLFTFFSNQQEPYDSNCM